LIAALAVGQSGHILAQRLLKCGGQTNLQIVTDDARYGRFIGFGLYSAIQVELLAYPTEEHL
jgi:hypothetical protein